MNEINDVVVKTFGAAVKPVLEFNHFFVKSTEAAFAKQFESYNAYVKLGIDNVREGFDVRSFDDIVNYTNKQQGFAKKTTDMLVSDAKSFSELNSKFTEEARSLFETNIKTSFTAVNEAVRSIR